MRSFALGNYGMFIYPRDSVGINYNLEGKMMQNQMRNRFWIVLGKSLRFYQAFPPGCAGQHQQGWIFIEPCMSEKLFHLSKRKNTILATFLLVVERPLPLRIGTDFEEAWAGVSGRVCIQVAVPFPFFFAATLWDRQAERWLPQVTQCAAWVTEQFEHRPSWPLAQPQHHMSNLQYIFRLSVVYTIRQ